jgi:hypothetical protein
MHKKLFEQLRKVKIICKTACGVNDIACKICTIGERFERPLQPLKGLYIKNIYVPELSYPPLKKYMNLKGLPNKIFSCMRCRWHRMHYFLVRKSIIYRRIRSRIQKGFNPWIRGPGGIVWWEKKRRSKISWHCPFKMVLLHCNPLSTQLLVYSAKFTVALASDCCQIWHLVMPDWATPSVKFCNSSMRMLN